MDDESKIEFREIKPDDFRKGVLSGEVNPHEVELTIRFKNGKVLKKEINWNDITHFYKYHNSCLVKEYYEMLIESNL